MESSRKKKPSKRSTFQRTMDCILLEFMCVFEHFEWGSGHFISIR